MPYDMKSPWNDGVRGTQVLPLINEDGDCIRVEAGPGTGKSFGLARRVLRLLLPEGLGISGQSVLVVAFNRVIAKDLRKTITGTLTKQDYGGKFPRIATLHGFCLDLLGIKVRVLLPHEIEAMAYDLLTLSKDLKERYKTHPKIMTEMRQQDAGHNDDILLRDQRDKWLIRHDAATISDVPGELLKEIKGGDHRDLRYDHVLVDEFQDLTPSEQELVLCLVKPGGTMIALGDPRQSIYRFRGNDREGLSKLENLTAMAVRDFPMTVCQRCPNRHVDAANVTMVSSDAAPLEYGSVTIDNTHLVDWNTPSKEAKGMARAIVENWRAYPDQDHLVTVTRRKFGYMLRNELLLLAGDLKVRLVFSESPLETWAVQEAFLAYCLLTDPDRPTWRAWLAYRVPNAKQNHLADSRNSVSYLNLLDLEDDKISMATMVAIVSGETTAKGKGRSHIKERAARILALQEQWDEKRSKPEEFVTAYFDIDAWRSSTNGDKETAENDFDTLRRLTLDLLSKEELGSAESRLKSTTAKLRTHIAVLDTETVEDEAVDVTIATLWSAKGVTADHVYVLGLCEEAIPGTRRDDYPGTPVDHYNEQQRLFYVTLTRSTRTLVLSRARKIKRADARDLNFKLASDYAYYPELHISPFLTRIIDTLPESLPGEDWPGCL